VSTPTAKGVAEQGEVRFFWPAVLNGVLAAPLMAVIMHMASSKKVKDKFTISLYLRIVGSAATAVMFAVSVGVFATWQ